MTSMVSSIRHEPGNQISCRQHYFFKSGILKHPNMCVYVQGRTQGGPRGPAPLGTWKTLFSGFLPLNYVIRIFEVFFLDFCYVAGLRKHAAW